MGSNDHTVLTIFCPQKGPSRRQEFVTRVMAEAGYDVVSRPVPKGICGSNPVNILVDEWPRIEAILKEGCHGQS
jgi:hypothetical protein